MDLNTKQDIMLRYKGHSDLYQFFSIVSKSRVGRLTEVVDAHLPPKQACPFTFLQDLAEKKEVRPAAAGAFLQDADLARAECEEAVARREAGPHLRRLLPRQAAEGQVARQAVLLGG